MLKSPLHRASFPPVSLNNNLALFSVLRDESRNCNLTLPARLLPDISAAHRRIRMASKVLTLRATPLSTISTGRPNSRSIISTVARLFDDLVELEKRIAEVTREIEALASRDDRARRLMTVPGIGPLVATAFVASAGDGSQFRRAKDLAAWLGLVPREHSTGGKTTLLGISKRGNHYLRRLLIHGARSCVIHLNRTADRLGLWLTGLEERMHVNKVTVALAAKIARVAWVILTRPGAIYDRRIPAEA